MASAGFNPLLRLDPASENFDADVRGLAAALIHADGGKEAHWDESAREVVASLITLEVLQAKEYQARGFKDRLVCSVCASASASAFRRQARGQ